MIFCSVFFSRLEKDEESYDESNGNSRGAALSLRAALIRLAEDYETLRHKYGPMMVTVDACGPMTDIWKIIRDARPSVMKRLDKKLNRERCALKRLVRNFRRKTK